MKGWRQAIFSALICLPAILIILVGAWLIGSNIPKAIKHEPSRIGREYRDVAESLIMHPEKALLTMEREKGWRQTSKINGVPWGYVVQGDEVIIWYQIDRRQCRGIKMKALRPFPYELVFYWGGGLVALVLLGVSIFSLMAFLHFTKARDDLLSAVAHDLTTPLVGMRALIGRNDGEAKALAERMLLIVDNINTFQRLGKARQPVLKPLDLIAMCKVAYSLFEADYADSVGGDVVFEDATDNGLEVLADETMAMQILWNLFGNDLKYAAPYGRVRVRFSADKQNAMVEFIDEGPGLTAWQRRKAFNRYYRAKSVLQSGKGGFGIGLCTSREFARLMGGNLIVRENHPTGCVFALTLPRNNVV